MTNLETHLTEALAPDDAPDSHDTPWTIDNDHEADWAGRKVRDARHRLNELQAQRDRIVAETDAWLQRESKPLNDDIEFFEGRLADWLRRELEADPDGKKTRTLPCGVTVKRTAARVSLEVTDEKALVEWLTANAEVAEGVLDWQPKYSKNDIKKLITDDGLAVPGVALVEGEHGWKVDA